MVTQAMNWLVRQVNLYHRREQQREFNFGWDYAAGMLLAGGETEWLEQKAQEAKDFGTNTSFDLGVLAACKAWELHHTTAAEL